MFCRNCGKEVAEQAVMCVSCGCPPKSGKKFCQNCGSETNPAAEVCITCGARLATAIPEGAESKMVAGLLGVLLEGLAYTAFTWAIQVSALHRLLLHCLHSELVGFGDLSKASSF